MNHHTGQDAVFAIVRSPTSVFVHWELNGERSTRVRGELGDALVGFLRVLSLTDGASRRLPVDLDAGSCYVDVSPGQTYGFEIGATAGGRLRTICRTGRIEVPPAAPVGAGRSAPAAQPLNRTIVKRPGAPPPAARGLDVPGLFYETTPLLHGHSSRANARPPE